MPRPFPLFLLLLLLGAATGCSQAVHFEPHMAYRGTKVTDKPLLIVIPDDFQEEEFTVRSGGFITQRKFKIFYGEALSHESRSRFRPLFGEVGIIDRSQFLDPSLLDEGMLEEGGELKEVKDGEEEEDLPLYPPPSFADDEVGYLLEFERVRFGFNNLRPVYAAQVRFVNRETGEVLLNGRLHATGTAPEPSNDATVQDKRLREAVVNACSFLLHEMSASMAAEIQKQNQPAETPAP